MLALRIFILKYFHQFLPMELISFLERRNRFFKAPLRKRMKIINQIGDYGLRLRKEELESSSERVVREDKQMRRRRRSI